MSIFFLLKLLLLMLLLLMLMVSIILLRVYFFVFDLFLSCCSFFRFETSFSSSFHKFQRLPVIQNSFYYPIATDSEFLSKTAHIFLFFFFLFSGCFFFIHFCCFFISDSSKNTLFKKSFNVHVDNFSFSFFRFVKRICLFFYHL